MTSIVEKRGLDNSEVNPIVCIHVWVTGRVQGVGFRNHVQTVAAKLKLTGWVRNVGDHMVETQVEGPRQKLEAFASAMKTGPPSSRVDEVKVVWQDAHSNFDSFHVKHSI